MLFIIGIVVSFATLSTGVSGRDSDVEQSVQRLAALMRLAGEESVLESAELSFELQDLDYRFLIFRGEDWTPMEDEILTAQELPEGLDPDLQLEGRTVVLTAPDKEKDKKAPHPQVVFLSSGEVTPFTLTLDDTLGTNRYVVKGTADGEITVKWGDRNEVGVH